MGSRHWFALILTVVAPSVLFANDQKINNLLSCVQSYASGIDFTDERYTENGISWQKPSRPFGFAERETLAEFNYKTESFNLRFFVRRTLNSSEPDMLVQFSYDTDKNISIKRLKDDYQTICEALGKPEKVIDYAFINDKESKDVHQIIADWKVGNRRIRFQSYAIDMDGKLFPLMPTIEVREVSLDQDLLDLVALKFIPKEGFNPTTSEWQKATMDPSIFLIDYNNGKILYPNYFEAGELTEITDNSIKALIKKKDSEARIEVDRYIGTYKMELRDLGPSGRLFRIRGEVQVTELKNARLF